MNGRIGCGVNYCARVGLVMIVMGLVFGFAIGLGFGINEGWFKDYVAQGIAAHPDVHDANSQGTIWRYAQRAHFHATGIAGFSLALVALMMLSKMGRGMVGVATFFIGLGNLYPLSWLTMFFMAPSLGRHGAHDYWLTGVFVYVSVLGLMVGLGIFIVGLFGGAFRADNRD